MTELLEENAVLTREQQKKLHRLRTDLPYYARNNLKIKDKKTGNFVPFIFKRAQQYLHEKVEDQKSRTGRVRVLVPKARQLGSSTYIGGRFYHRTSMNKGVSTFILSHEAKTTAKLFDMVNRFYDNSHEELRQEKEISNKNQLRFAEIGSEYTIGTAGNKDIGRGSTNQLFHGSEPAYWENPISIQAGIMQSVPDAPDTEIFLESTGNGVGGFFYEMCMAAMEGRGEYILVFLPWFWDEDYEADVPLDFKETPEEESLRSAYLQEFTLDQARRKLMFRRNKIAEFNNLDWLFRQEYPSNVMECFQNSGSSLYNPEKLAECRGRIQRDPNAPRVMGVDPARRGDRTVLVYREGRSVPAWWKFLEMDEMRLSGLIIQKINQLELDMVFIDVAMGYGTYDRVLELGYGSRITPVHFGEKAISEDNYLNRRAEMAGFSKKWIEEGGRIPDDEEFFKDLAVIPDFEYSSSGRLKLPAKDKIKETLGFSPDIFDAFILTFAHPVFPQRNRLREFIDEPMNREQKKILKTSSRFKKQNNTGRLLWV